MRKIIPSKYIWGFPRITAHSAAQSFLLCSLTKGSSGSSFTDTSGDLSSRVPLPPPPDLYLLIYTRAFCYFCYSCCSSSFLWRKSASSSVQTLQHDHSGWPKTEIHNVMFDIRLIMIELKEILSSIILTGYYIATGYSHWWSYHNIVATPLLSILSVLPPSLFSDRSGGSHGAVIKELGHLRLVLACTAD